MKRTTLKNGLLGLSILVLFLLNTSLTAQTNYDYAFVKSKADSIFSECNGQPGCAVGVMHNNNLIYQNGFGFSNMDLKTPTTTSTVFEIGTLSMHFTSAGIMLLEDAGKLRLDDELQKFIPEIPIYKEGKITIRNLLTHTSGIRDYIVLLMAAGNPLDTSYDNAQALASLRKQQALCVVPGSTYRFSQSNYTLLAMVIERITGQTYPEYMKEHLFLPAGMSNSLIYSSPNDVIENRASAYEGQSPNYQRILSDHFLANGSSRVMTSINDLVKWNRFLDQKMLSGESLFKRISRTSTLNNGMLMTYRFGLEGGSLLGHELIAHNGYSFGYNAMYLNFPNEALSIVALNSNMNISAPGKAYDLAEAILPEVTVQTSNNTRPAKRLISLDKRKLSAFVGDYFSLDNGYLRKIHLVNDTLRLEVNSNVTSTIVPLSENEFTIDTNTSDVNIVFEKSGNGHQMSITINGREPAIYKSYKPADYNTKELSQFEGNFYSEELGVSYTIDISDNTLSTYVGERRLVDYVSAMDDNFTSAHDGFITFQRDKKGEITGFVLSDYSLGSISFTKS